MYCNSCGNFIPDGQKFCVNCGSPAPQIPVQQQAQPVQPVQQVQPFEPVIQPIAPIEPIFDAPANGSSLTGPKGNGIALAGMLMAIASILLFWFPLVGAGIGVVALVLSIVGVTRKNRSKGKAIAGIIIAVIGILLGALLTNAFVNSWNRKQDAKIKINITTATTQVDETPSSEETSDSDVTASSDESTEDTTDASEETSSDATDKTDDTSGDSHDL